MPTLNVRAIAESLTPFGSPDRVVAGEQALDRDVSSVATISRLEQLEALHPDALLIVSREVATCDDAALDLVLRRAAAARASCVVVDSGSGVLPLPTRRLAEKFGVALWAEEGLDLPRFRSRVEQLVDSPELVGASMVREVSDVMLAPARDFGELIDRLAKALGYPVALIGVDGNPLAGTPLAPAEQIAAAMEARHDHDRSTELMLETETKERIVLVEAFPSISGQPRLWIAARVPRGLDGSSGHIVTSLKIASLALSAHLAQSSLAYERENRETRVLFDELISKGEQVLLADIERAAALGWQLVGWHVGVQVRARRSISAIPLAALGRSLLQALAANDIPVRPVDTGSAVVFWTTTTTRPGPAPLTQLSERIQVALADVERGYPGVRLRAGIGEPHQGAGGIALTLDDALHALAFAESQLGDSVVQRTDTMTANRLVREWLPAGAAREVVASLIQPLQNADRSGQLIGTLRAYLDNESNVTRTADQLHIHRNTAIMRLQQIRSLIAVDIDDPSDRLAVQLALRLQE